MKPLSHLLAAACAFALPFAAPSLHAAEPAAESNPLERLQTLWREDLSKREQFKKREPRLSQQLFEKDHVTVSEVAGELAAKRVEAHARAKKDLVLTGDVAELRKHPKLTEVRNVGTHTSGFSAFLAPDGTLVLFWIIPEG